MGQDEFANKTPFNRAKSVSKPTVLTRVRKTTTRKLTQDRSYYASFTFRHNIIGENIPTNDAQVDQSTDMAEARCVIMQ